jgi:type I restriction enzyme M protein
LHGRLLQGNATLGWHRSCWIFYGLAGVTQRYTIENVDLFRHEWRSNPLRFAPSISLSPDCATLLEHVPSDGASIGNLKLREQLGWDEERYAAARQPLLDLGVLETGRGRGGAVKRSVSREGGESESSPAQASLAFEETPSAPKATTASRQPAASRNAGSSQFEQTFKNIDDVMWKDSGCTSELDYSEQSSWLLFLKYLDSLEHSKAQEAALEGRAYTHILGAPYRWST